jgi:Tfp pilus assembly protein PilV
MKSLCRRNTDGQRGLTALEVLVAAFLVLIVFFGLAQFYTRGRRHLGYEEDRRKATAVAQDRIDGIRRDYTFDEIPLLHLTDTVYVVDGKSFTVLHSVTEDVDTLQAWNLGLQVTWDRMRPDGTAVPGTLEATTILGRGMP